MSTGEAAALIAQPKGMFSSVIFLKQGEETVATIEMTHIREKGILSIGDRVWRMGQKKAYRSDFLLEDADGNITARATQPSAWSDRFVITFGTMEFELKRPSAWKDTFHLSWNGESLGRVERPRVLSRETHITLAKSLPLELRAFVFWLVMTQWNRDAAV